MELGEGRVGVGRRGGGRGGESRRGEVRRGKKGERVSYDPYLIPILRNQIECRWTSSHFL